MTARRPTAGSWDGPGELADDDDPGELADGAGESDVMGAALLFRKCSGSERIPVHEVNGVGR